jgi:large subunit ribosomal protein L1
VEQYLPHGQVRQKYSYSVPLTKFRRPQSSADFTGLDEYITNQEGWTGIDVIVAMPSVMAGW